MGWWFNHVIGFDRTARQVEPHSPKLVLKSGSVSPSSRSLHSYQAIFLTELKTPLTPLIGNGSFLHVFPPIRRHSCEQRSSSVPRLPRSSRSLTVPTRDKVLHISTRSDDFLRSRLISDKNRVSLELYTINMAYLWAGVAIIVGLISYLGLTSSKNTGPSLRKAQQAKAMREAFKSLDKQSVSTKKVVASKV